ncbi:MAG: hypothetical protein ACRC7R_05005 [Sarcina sp.]
MIIVKNRDSYIFTKEELEFCYQIGYSKMQYILDHSERVEDAYANKEEGTYEVTYKEIYLFSYNDLLDGEEVKENILKKISGYIYSKYLSALFMLEELLC